MRISAIKYQHPKQPKPTIWTARHNNQNMRNVLVHYGESTDLQQFCGALHYALGGIEAELALPTVVHLYDSSGDLWVIDREQEPARILKNKMPTDGEEQFRGALLADCPDDTGLIVEIQQVAVIGEQLTLLPHLCGQSGTHRKINEGLHREIRKVLEKTLGKLKVKGDMDPSRLAEIVAKLDKLATKRASLLAMAQSLKTQRRTLAAGSIPQSKQSASEEELKLVTEIRRHAHLVLNPGEKPSELTARLKKVRKQLKELDQVQEKHMATSGEGCPNWDGIFEDFLSVKTVMTRLKASELTYKTIRTEIQQVLETYLGSLKSVLNKDERIIAQVERCLQKLAQPPKHKLLSRFQKSSDFSEEEKAELKDIVTTLTLLGDSVEKIKTDYVSCLDKLAGQSEKLATEHGKARQRWLKTAEQLELTHKSSLNELMQLFLGRFRKIRLLEEKNYLESRIKEIKGSYQELSRLIWAWRKHVGSQKTTAVETPSIIVREVRSILQVHDKREEKLLMARGQQYALKALDELVNATQKNIGVIDSEWNNVAKEYGLPGELPDAATLKDLHQAVAVIDQLNHMVDEDPRPAQNQISLKEKRFLSPVTILYWPEQFISNKHRLDFLAALETQHEETYFVLLIGDRVLLEMLKNLKVTCTSRFQKVTKAKPEASLPSKSTPTPLLNVQDPVISPRAQEALKIFQQKQKKPTLS